MTPLVILLSIFIILWLINKVSFGSRWQISLLGRISMAVMLIFTGLAHFINTAQMKEMIPDFVKIKEIIIYLTGIVEIVIALGLITRGWSKLASLILIIFFIAVLPSNVIGSIKHLDFGGMHFGPDYLYIRIPIQLVFIFWAYYFGIRKNRVSSLLKT